jgi:hypothetical protein
MGWDKGGRYYTRSKRVNGRVVREYVGGGAKGEEAARQDALQRQQRQAERAAARAKQAEIEHLDVLFEEYDALLDLMIHAALTAEGYRLHRGEWRKRRKPRQEATPKRGNSTTVTEAQTEAQVGQTPSCNITGCATTPHEPERGNSAGVTEPQVGKSESCNRSDHATTRREPERGNSSDVTETQAGQLESCRCRSARNHAATPPASDFAAQVASPEMPCTRGKNSRSRTSATRLIPRCSLDRSWPHLRATTRTSDLSNRPARSVLDPDNHKYRAQSHCREMAQLHSGLP